MTKTCSWTMVIRIVLGGVVACLLLAGPAAIRSVQAQEPAGGLGIITLPPPALDGAVSIEKALFLRRSARTYQDQPLSMTDCSQILWAAQGITEPTRGLRTAPSARATYPLRVYLVAGKVTDLAPGLYRYEPRGHKLTRIEEGDVKARLLQAATQNPIGKAPVAVVIAGLSGKASNPSWVPLEVGHAAQNICLQAVSLRLGTVTMGGFNPQEVKKALNLPGDENPFYIMPVGKI